ncbi:hypothetical protein PDG61_28685 [Mycolicibacterium sp. BiH015]|uniref:hypothetical protein n=1 Tax=Mycolicibacterium sp. BiH015 TaxID=3018808 RepID=UPI0022E12E8D|nr:hypothetical protein [Mycolicibacterium sp. BiH015]MDA2894921.1 hypothetical protein [Mycolicibacterium sp. BiH015]
MPTPPSDRVATVWSSTFIPSKSPFSDFGADGYSVAWVDTAEGRIQVLVEGDRPASGTVGAVVVRTLDEQAVDVFTAGHA